MAKYNYISISLRRDCELSAKTVFSYPSDGGADRWEQQLVDPGAAVQRFLNAQECHVMQRSPRGNCFSLITRGADHRTGMVSMMVDDCHGLTGKQVAAALMGLKPLLEDESLRTDAAVDAVLEQAGVPVEPVRVQGWCYRAAELPQGVQMADAAYRTYVTVRDLETIFSFPSQPEYDLYRCILVVAATVSLRPGVRMTRITQPVKRQYTVVAEQDVRLSAQTVFDGERLEITYTKRGYDDKTETVTVGQPSPYVKYDGARLTVRDPHKCGLMFSRRLPLEVVSAKGGQITGYTVSVNERPVSTVHPWVELTERDLAGDVAIEAASTGYRPLKLTFTSDQLLGSDGITLAMQPLEQGVTLRLDFGQGRVIESQLMLEKNTPEYNRLHSGLFHGHRANRQVMQDGSEVYNVDVRAAVRTETPLSATASPVETHSPMFEDVAHEAVDAAPKVDFDLPQEVDDADVQAEPRRLRLTPKMKRLLAAAGAFVAFVTMLWLLLTGGNKPEEADAGQGEPVVAAADTVAALPQPAHVPAMDDEVTADVAYLNVNGVWVADSLRSESAKRLMAAMAAGDIEGVVKNDYFAVSGRCTNAEAERVADMLWRTFGSPSMRGAKSRLSKEACSGRVDLHALYESVARSQPKAEDANTEARPRR